MSFEPPLPFCAKAVRKTIFLTKFPFDEELMRIVDPFPSHAFLKNPNMHNAHIYLVEYVVAFSRQYFGRSDFKILDWGAGKCQVSYLLKKRGLDVTACDLAMDEQDSDSTFGQETPIKDFMNLEVVPLRHEYKLPFADNSFDVVLSFGVLEHVPNDQESLKEIGRILKPNGLFFCTFLPYALSYKQNLHYIKGDRYHDHFYSNRKVKRLLKNANMRWLDHWYRDLFPITPFAKKKFLAAHYYEYSKFENRLCWYTVLGRLASNIEFVAVNKKISHADF